MKLSKMTMIIAMVSASTLALWMAKTPATAQADIKALLIVLVACIIGLSIGSKVTGD